MSHPVQRLQMNIRNTTDRDRVYGPCLFHLSYTSRCVKEGMTEIGGALVHSHAQIGSPACLCEFDEDIAHLLHTLTKFCQRGFGTTNRHRMVSFRETLDQVIHKTVPFFPLPGGTSAPGEQLTPLPCSVL